MKNFDNIAQQKADYENFGDTISVSDYENFGDTISVSPIKERNIALDLGLTGRSVWW